MSYRKFKDRSGAVWQVRDESLGRWVFAPEPGNLSDRRTVAAPGYTDDPFELSDAELQRLLDGSQPDGGSKRPPSPFKEP